MRIDIDKVCKDVDWQKEWSEVCKQLLAQKQELGKDLLDALHVIENNCPNVDKAIELLNKYKQ